ncbi:trimethyltridecatetraene synthase [Ziziphus jujuba]|uniref:Trimethyltridecatetraene synthase n=1 Tax=Ziziphus jujuba TaxID=326968 RepID=A0A6P4A533_ZIZJJ|nr:trimethyltridecatetraene synthase [Ziziphus jujuba]
MPIGSNKLLNSIINTWPNSHINIPQSAKKMEALIPSWAVVTLICVATLAFVSKTFFQKSQNSLYLPPGPKPWPIIGNLNLIGPLPHQSLHKLSQIYGPIMQLKFGSFPVVIASSAEMAKQFLKTHDHVFASRPQMAAGKYTTYNYSNITWAPYGPYWRQGRKIYLSELFSSKRLESYEYIRVEERLAFLKRLYLLSGKPILLKDQLSRVTLSIISRIVLGKKYFSESSKSEKSIVTLEEFQEMLDELFLLNGVLNIGDWIPWLKFLDLQGYEKRMKALKKKFDRFHDYVFDEHKARNLERGENSNIKDLKTKDMVDLLLQLADDPDLEVKLTYNSVKGFTQDLVAGGTDTSATTVEWAMSELLKQPNLIKKANEELDRVIGRERWVEEKDIPRLPFIEAIMKETMRIHPVAVMLAPHLALDHCNVGGYDIRKGTRVFVNTWSIGRDPSVWDSPEEFRPERFLGKAIDVKGQNFELLPFGSGRRMCPGYSLGLKMIQSSLANMLHGFKWKLPDDMKEEDLSMDEVYGLATIRKFPLVAVTEPRLPDHLYHM